MQCSLPAHQKVTFQCSWTNFCCCCVVVVVIVFRTDCWMGKPFCQWIVKLCLISIYIGFFLSFLFLCSHFLHFHLVCITPLPHKRTNTSPVYFSHTKFWMKRRQRWNATAFYGFNEKLNKIHTLYQIVA